MVFYSTNEEYNKSSNWPCDLQSLGSGLSDGFFSNQKSQFG
jgi:hypothetical protein